VSRVQRRFRAAPKAVGARAADARVRVRQVASTLRVTVVTLFARTLVTLFEKVGRVEDAVEA